VVYVEKASAEEVQEILDRLKLFGGILGPVVPEAMATLDGWNWQTDWMLERLILTRGDGPVPLIPAIRATGEREKGWLMTLQVTFSDPDTEILYSADNWAFVMSPRFLNMMGMTLPNNTTIYNHVYNPATPLGPMYGIAWYPAKFWPYKTQITLQAQHPATAPTATSQVVIALIGRMYIRDSKQYYESIFIENQRQSIGRVQVPLRRSS